MYEMQDETTNVWGQKLSSTLILKKKIQVILGGEKP